MEPKRSETFFFPIGKGTAKPKPSLTSSTRRLNTVCQTKEEIDKKLVLAEERRRKHNEIRAKQAIENRVKVKQPFQGLDDMIPKNCTDNALQDQKHGQAVNCV